ncbi:anti-sigma-D factor RsdA [Mycobacterium sp. NPDC050041]|uniref:anti-sigma-D factor RsdA n=1 Tax=Mycobacterium sp. NPDC050041 TaxID=3364293 RepID=UPI003C2CD979
MPDFGRWTNNGGDPSLNEVNRTDRFLDALAGEQPVYSTDAGEAELAYVLAGWRDEVRQAPVTSVVTTRDAVQALDRSASSRQRSRASMAVLGSVAAAVLAVGGFGAVIAGAGPDDPLYGLRTALFGEQQQTRDDQVVLAAQSQLAEVQQLIDQGDWTAAQNKLQTMTTTVAAVDDSTRQEELVEQWQQLSVKVDTRDVNATVPPDAPPLVLPEIPPDLPLPVILDPDATTSTPTTTSPGEIPGSTSSPTTSSPTTSPSDGTTSPSTPLPTPSSQLPLPTPSPRPSPTPLPTPSPQPAPLPTPSPRPIPTPQPQVPTSTVIPAPPVPPPPVQLPPVPLPPVEEPQAEQPPVDEPVELPQPRLSGGGAQNPGPASIPPVLQMPELVLPEVATPQDAGE